MNPEQDFSKENLSALRYFPYGDMFLPKSGSEGIYTDGLDGCLSVGGFTGESIFMTHVLFREMEDHLERLSKIAQKIHPTDNGQLVIISSNKFLIANPVDGEKHYQDHLVDFRQNLGKIFLPDRFTVRGLLYGDKGQALIRKTTQENIARTDLQEIKL